MDPKKETMNEEELKAHTAHTGQQDQGETEKRQPRHRNRPELKKQSK